MDTKYVKTKYCKFCGDTIDYDCVVCPKCGKQVEELSSASNGNIVINNSSSASAVASTITSSGHRSLPWYLGTGMIIFLGFLTGGIYWILGPILRVSWRSNN
jgi:RNA polymerase subunit RPABC4/transcription elongation factor Spt4